MDYEEIFSQIEETLFQEKSRLTPEEKERQYRTLKSLDYDPKTKTISDKTGGRIKLNIDKTNTSDTHTTVNHTRQKKLDRQSAYHDLFTKKRDAKVDPDEFGNVPEVGDHIITSKLPKKMVNGKMQIDRAALAKMKLQAAQAELDATKNDGNKKEARAHSITINQKDLQDDTKALHELGEVNNVKKQRQIAKGINDEKTLAYKSAKAAAEKEIKKNKHKLNSHDRNSNEILADQFVKRHSKHEDSDDRLNGRLHQDSITRGRKERKEMDKFHSDFKKDVKDLKEKAFLRDSLLYAGTSAAGAAGDAIYGASKVGSKIKQKRDIKSADTRREIGNKTYDARNKAAFEKVLDLIIESTDMDVDYAEALYEAAYERYIKE